MKLFRNTNWEKDQETKIVYADFLQDSLNKISEGSSQTRYEENNTSILDLATPESKLTEKEVDEDTGCIKNNRTLTSFSIEDPISGKKIKKSIKKFL